MAAQYTRTTSIADSMSQMTKASLIIFFIALYMSKVSAVSFMSRFAQPGRHWSEIYLVLSVTTILGIGSIMSLSISCSTPDSISYWDFAHSGAQCAAQVMRWKPVTAMDVASELLVLALPLDSICSLQMAVSKKCWVLSAFYIRLP